MSIKLMESLGLVGDRPTYSKYKELLQAQRAKTSRLFNGWTKAGRCELVAKEILERLVVYWGIDMADKDLLLEVLNTEVLPKVDEKCRAQITQQLDQVLPEVNKRCREKILYQKRSDLENLENALGYIIWSPATILGRVNGEERNKLIEQLHTLFVEKLSGCKEINHCCYNLEKVPKNEILDFVSLLNRINIPVDHAHRYIGCLQQAAARKPDGMRVISELLNRVPAKATALGKILVLSESQAPNLLDILEKVPTREQKETLIDQFHILFVDKVIEYTDIIHSCIKEFNEIPINEIADFVTLLNCLDAPAYEFNDVLRDLKKIVKGNPDAVRPITDLLRMVPAKADALIKILKLPDAVPNLLDILKKIPTREQKETLIDQIHTLFFERHQVSVELPSFGDYLSCFQGLPENERSDFIFLLNDLMLSDKSYKSEKFAEYIQVFKNYPVEERRAIANQAKRFLANLGPYGLNCTAYAALNLVLAIPTEEMRNTFIDQIPTLLGDIRSHLRSNASILLCLFLFQNEENMRNQAEGLALLFQDLPIQKQIALIFQAQRLYAGLSPLVGNPSGAVALLKEKISENEREIFIGQIPSLVGEVNRLNGLTNNVKLQVLLFIFQRVAPAERSDFIQHLCNLRVPNIQDHLENLLALPVNERADRIEAINLQYELENAQAALINRPLGRLIVDPADFSDEARNPTRPLLQLFAEINQNQRFPRIRYQNSEGSDAGGLTRDFVSQIFQALCHPDQKNLPLMASDDRYFPKVEVAPPPALPLEDQIKCYQAIGMLFARAINGDPSLAKGKDSVTTGTHFHPNMFAMMHALTLDEMNLIPDPLAHDSVPDVKLKLTKLYLKAQFPQLFRPHGIEEAIVDDEIVKLMNGEVSQRLQESGVDEDFLKDYHINSIIQATLTIAKSMHKNLALSDQWAGIIGNSPESLSKRIEGSLTPDLVIDAFGLKDEAEDTRKGMVKRWVRTASPEALKNFVFSLTGSTSLSPGQRLSVQLCEVLDNPENAPVFHTCGQYMDLPQYETYEIFEAKLGISIASAMAGGFQVA